MNWFPLGGDARLNCCATRECFGQVTWRCESEEFVGNYCSGCHEWIRSVTHFKPTHFISAMEHNVGVKDFDFFKSQGGFENFWGRYWEPVIADSLYAARYQGIAIRRHKYPGCLPTLGEREDLEDVWPEARGL